MRIKRREKISVLEVRGDESSTTDPYSMFLFAMRSPKTREKCTGRLRMFFDFIGIPGDSMVERSKIFCERAKGLLAVLYSMFNIKRKELREKR